MTAFSLTTSYVCVYFYIEMNAGMNKDTETFLWGEASLLCLYNFHI